MLGINKPRKSMWSQFNNKHLSRLIIITPLPIIILSNDDRRSQQ